MNLFSRVKNQIKNKGNNIYFWGSFFAAFILIIFVIWPWLLADNWWLVAGQILTHLLLTGVFSLVVNLTLELLKWFIWRLAGQSLRLTNQSWRLAGQKKTLAQKFGIPKTNFFNRVLIFSAIVFLWPRHLVYLYRWPDLSHKFVSWGYWRTFLWAGVIWLLGLLFFQMVILIFNRQLHLKLKIGWLKLVKRLGKRFGKRLSNRLSKLLGSRLNWLGKWINRFNWPEVNKKVGQFLKNNFLFAVVLFAVFILAKTNYDLHQAWIDPVLRWQEISLQLEDDWQAWQNYAEALEEQKQISAAINVYLKIYAQQQGNINLLIKIGDLFARQGSLAEADYYYLQAQRLKPSQELINKRFVLRQAR